MLESSYLLEDKAAIGYREHCKPLYGGYTSRLNTREMITLTSMFSEATTWKAVTFGNDGYDDEYCLYKILWCAK